MSTDTHSDTKSNFSDIAASSVGTTQSRFMKAKREPIDVGARTVELAFSSETLVRRSYGWELLDHGPGSCDLSVLNDSAPLLMDHRFDRLVGVIESARIDSDRVGRALTRFGKSESADEAFNDVADGIRKHVSCQYEVLDAKHDGEKDGLPIIRVTRWRPVEVTLTAIPADRKVGVGRSAEPEPAPAAAALPTPVTRTAPMTGEVATQTAPTAAELAAIETRGANQALARVQEIIALGEQYAEHGGREIAASAIRDGKDERYVRDLIMQRMVERSNASPTAPDIGLTDKETRSFSVLRLIRAMTATHKGERDAWKDAGFERECHEALLKRHGDPANGGFFVPYEVQKRGYAKRDMTVAGSGGYLVGTENQPGSFIELLRAQTVVGRAGARMLTGLKGDITIPKQTGAATAYLVGAEDDEITESNQTIGQLAMSPKTVGAYTEISRLLQMQSDPSVDMLVMEDIAKQIALKIDLLALNGNGAGGPVGIINTSGIGSVTATSLDYAKAIEFQTDVASGNALVPGCVYLTTPTKAAICAQRQRFSSTDTPLWVGNILEGNMLGFRGLTTTQLSDGMIFGDFSQLIMAEWGVLELAVDPTANFKAGISGIRGFQSFDVGIRNAAAFSYGSSVT